MKKFNGIVIVLISLVSMGCPDPFHGGTTNSNFLYVSYKNTKGEDLLNPSTVGTYNVTNSIVCNPSAAFIAVVQPSAANQLPAGYYLSFRRRSDGVTNINGVISATIFISLRSNVTDTLTYFLGSTQTNNSPDITSCKYNKALYKPPGGAKVFPAPAYITVVK